MVCRKQGRGAKTELKDRIAILELLKEAVGAGARQSKACDILGIDERTMQRWKLANFKEDCRKGPLSQPASSLSQEERQVILKVVTSSEFYDKSPRQIVPALADQGVYLGSESTIYRLLQAEKLMTHRGKSRPPRKIEVVSTYHTTRPRELFSWDITYLPTLILGIYYYLYLFMDVFSRKIVG